MTSPPPSVLVLGAGELGGAVLRHLAQHPARGATRLAVLRRSHSTAHASSKHEDESSDIEFIQGDLVTLSEAQLAAIFSAFHTIVSCTGMSTPPSTQLKLTHAVLRSSAQRYFPWQYGVSYDDIGRNSAQDLFDTQLEVRALLRAQTALRWTIVSTGMFTSFLFEPAFGVVDEGTRVVTALGGWENRITVTAPEDIGRLVAEMVLVCPELEGVVYTAGDTVSMRQLADVVDEVLDRRVGRVLKTVPQLKEELGREPDDVMRKYRAVFAEGVGVAWDRATSFNVQRGIDTQSVKQWAMQNL